MPIHQDNIQNSIDYDEKFTELKLSFLLDGLWNERDANLVLPYIRSAEELPRGDLVPLAPALSYQVQSPFLEVREGATELLAKSPITSHGVTIALHYALKLEDLDSAALTINRSLLVKTDESKALRDFRSTLVNRDQQFDRSVHGFVQDFALKRGREPLSDKQFAELVSAFFFCENQDVHRAAIGFFGSVAPRLTDEQVTDLLIAIPVALNNRSNDLTKLSLLKILPELGSEAAPLTAPIKNLIAKERSTELQLAARIALASISPPNVSEINEFFSIIRKKRPVPHIFSPIPSKEEGENAIDISLDSLEEFLPNTSALAREHLREWREEIAQSADDKVLPSRAVIYPSHTLTRFREISGFLRDIGDFPKEALYEAQRELLAIVDDKKEPSSYRKSVLYLMAGARPHDRTLAKELILSAKAEFDPTISEKIIRCVGELDLENYADSLDLACELLQMVSVEEHDSPLKEELYRAIERLSRRLDIHSDFSVLDTPTGNTAFNRELDLQRKESDYT